VANHLEAVFLQVRLALERSLFAVGRTERHALYVERAERSDHAAEGSCKGNCVLGLQARQEIGFGITAERVAGCGMGENNGVGFHHREERGAFVDVLDLAADALFLSVMASGGTTGDQPREMHRNARRCHGEEFGFDRRVAWRDEEAQTRTPSLHERSSTPGRWKVTIARTRLAAARLRGSGRTIQPRLQARSGWQAN
jgi:hypothetical protein